MLAEDSGKSLAKSGERKAQVRAALVAARGADADQCSTSGADLRTRLVVSAATKESPHRTFPALQPPLPLIGLRQFSSLRAAHRVPIIQNPQLFTRNEELWA